MSDVTTSVRVLRGGPSAASHRLPSQSRRRRAVRAESASQVARTEHTVELLERARCADPGARQQLLDEVVVANMPVASAIASRYRNRGIADEDLDQVAYVGLIKAADGFDTQVGTPFLSYAVPTIRGEIKRHFRDRGWMIRPPRRIQELQARISGANTELSQSLGRSPRPSEVAAHLGEELDEVNETLATLGCFTPSSLDRPVGDDGSAVVGDLLGAEDDAHGAIEARAVLAPLIRGLSERDQRIVLLRFFRGWTQAEIAADIGVTQMQVSRLLTRIMSNLRAGIEESGDVAR